MGRIGKIEKFIKTYCEERKAKSCGEDVIDIYMNNHYLTTRIANNKTTSDKLMKILIEHEIYHVEGYCDYKKDDKSDVACIGFSEKEQKWYGWSHRAIFGFGIGFVVTEGSCCAESGWDEDYLAAHPEEDFRCEVGFEVKNMEDAKKCAIAFADCLS